MQTFEELEKKLLNDHGNEYKTFTRLILSLSIGTLAFLISFQKNIVDESALYGYLSLISLSGFFISSFFGVLVQHRLMMRPLKDLEQAKKRLSSQEGESDLPIRIYRKPELTERIFYKLQIILFLLSFLPLIFFLYFNYL